MTYTLTAEQMQQVREKVSAADFSIGVAEYSRASRLMEEALALLDAAMQAPEATDREGWLTREEIANLSRPLPAGEKWATIPEAELQALCRMALFALSVPAEATAGGDVREAGAIWRDEQRQALAWALLPPREWDSYDHKRAAVHAEVLKRMHAALAAAPKPCKHGCVDGKLRGYWDSGPDEIVGGGPCPIHGTKPEAPTELCKVCGQTKEFHLNRDFAGQPTSHPFTPTDAKGGKP